MIPTSVYAILVIVALCSPILISIYNIRQRLQLSESFIYALERCLKREINLLKDESSLLKHTVDKLKVKKPRKKYLTKKRLESLRKEDNGEQSSTELPTS